MLSLAERVHEARDQLARHHGLPLYRRAFIVAEHLRGIAEQGENQGAAVAAIIHANGGAPGEAWCGDFVAYCYRVAGSHAVNRSWASVSMLGSVSGVTRTRYPRRGDLVRFSFDHVELFDSWLDPYPHGERFSTIGGNTGDGSPGMPTGGVVYHAERTISEVHDFLHVTR
jgi:hypothetical protein